MNAYIVPEEMHEELTKNGIVVCTSLCIDDICRNVTSVFVEGLESIELKEMGDDDV